MKLIQSTDNIDRDDVVSLYISDTQIKYQIDELGDKHKILPALVFVCTTAKCKPYHLCYL